MDYFGHSECLAAAIGANKLDALADPRHGRSVLEVGGPGSVAFHVKRPGAPDRRASTLLRAERRLPLIGRAFDRIRHYVALTRAARAD